MITRTFSEIYLTPVELAAEFANMDNDRQAIFFNEVAKITSKWPRDFCFQIQAIIDSPELTSEGRKIMEELGEYGKP